jgi:hypothetical protein
MPTVHKLKIAPRWFDAVSYGAKPFEVRRDDRDYQVGDVLVLREWIEYHWTPWGGYYTGRSVMRRVTYVLRHEDFPQGIAEGYCVLGLGGEGQV